MMRQIQILVVEQSAPIRTLLTHSLQSAGFSCKVITVVDRFSALEQIDQHLFDLAIVDDSLDDGEGLELCRLLRQNQPEIELVLLSDVDKRRLSLIREWPELDGFLTKPFNVTQLLELVICLLQTGSSQVATVSPDQMNLLAADSLSWYLGES